MTYKSILATSVAALAFPGVSVAGDLDSWAEGTNKSAILDFVADVTTEGSANFVPVEDRVAVFDNDGTLWTEKPTYTEVIFALSQLESLVDENPDWETTEPFSIVLEKGLGALKEIGLSGAIQVLTGVYAALDDDEFAARAEAFLASDHLTAGRTYGQATFKSVVELVDLLQKNDFEVYIVSGGTNNFLREFAAEAYNISPRNVIGSIMAVNVEVNGAEVTLTEEPKLEYFNDGATKVKNAAHQLGARPTIVVGNSEGDLPLTNYALGGDGARMGVLIHHDDADREAAYDRGAEDAIAQASASSDDNFLLVSMKNDFIDLWSD